MVVGVEVAKAERMSPFVCCNAFEIEQVVAVSGLAISAEELRL